MLDHQRGAMCQTGKLAQRRPHRRAVEAERCAHSQRRQGIGQIVVATDLQLVGGDPAFRAPAQPGFAARAVQAKIAVARRIEREAQYRTSRLDHGQHRRIIGVNHHHAIAVEHALLGGAVIIQAGIAVHVVGADVQHRRHSRVQAVGSFQLKAGQFQHIQFRRIGRTFAVLPQFQRRCAQVAAHRRPHPGPFRHQTQQGGHRALAVGTGDRRHRHLRQACQQFDITPGRYAAGHGSSDRRRRQRNPRTDQQAIGACQQRRVEAAQIQRDIGALGTQRRQPGRIGAAVRHGKGRAQRVQRPRRRQTALAQADHQRHSVQHALPSSSEPSAWPGQPAPTRW